MPASSDVIITDTSCLIILQKINALYILKAIFSTVITTPQIKAEYGFALPEWIVINSVYDSGLITKFANHVDLGEASAICLAVETGSRYIIIDDAQAR